MTREQILSLNTMSEEKARTFLICHDVLGRDPEGKWLPDETSLPDLAFRLRDETCKISCEKYYEGLEIVYKHKYPKSCVSFGMFYLYQITPLEMICANLLAGLEQ